MKDQTHASLNNNLSVSQCQLELQKKEEIRKSLYEQMREVCG